MDLVSWEEVGVYVMLMVYFVAGLGLWGGGGWVYVRLKVYFVAEVGGCMSG